MSPMEMSVQQEISLESASTEEIKEIGNLEIMIRKSGRARRSTVTIVKGHVVKVANMYDLNEGEPSVFSSEFDRSGRAPSVFAPTEGGSYLAPASAVKKPKTASINHRVISENVKFRRDQNSSMASLHAHLDNRRHAWMWRHLALLEPWIPVKAVNALKMKNESKDVVKLDAVEWAPLDRQPEAICGVMREYQVKGSNFMCSMGSEGVGCILADEMGLGKTLQSIALIAHLKLVLRQPGACLVVVPLSVLSSWVAELKKWCPTLRVAKLHTSSTLYHAELAASVLKAGEGAPDVVVTTYEMVKTMSALTHIYWRLLILDEGHLIKNEESGRAHALKKVRAASTVLLTGTPLQNNLHELWALLSFLNPIFSDPTPFDEAFNLGTSHHVADPQALQKAHQLLRLFCLRRTKQEVEVSLPPLIETRVECPLSTLQTFWYRRLLLRDSKLLSQIETQDRENAHVPGGNNWQKLKCLFMQLRKVCNHPYLFPDAEDFDGTTGEDIVEASGKLAVLDRLLNILYHQGHRVVLFSQFTSVLDILEDLLQLRGFRNKYLRLDGGTNRVQRTVDICEFNRPARLGRDRPFCFLLSTRAGGLGVNLQTADTVILYDTDWNPQVDLQAIARVHRIGQTKPVAALRLMTADTVEQRMVERAEKKLYLDAMVGRGSTANSQELDRKESEDGMTTHDLLHTLAFGADRIFSNPSGTMPSNQALTELLASARHFKKEPTHHPAEVSPAPCPPTPNLPQSYVKVEVSSPCSIEQNLAATPSALFLSPDSGTSVIKSAKKLAANFNAENTFSVKTTTELRAGMLSSILMVEEAKLKASGGTPQASLKEISREVAAEAEALKQGRSERKRRLVEVKDANGKVHQVLRENMYNLEDGESSIFASEFVQRNGKSGLEECGFQKRKIQKVGRDYPHSELCQICWEPDGYWKKTEHGLDAAFLWMCTSCPCVYHGKCLGEKGVEGTLRFGGQWTCPHHTCCKCGINAQEAGGLLFRCECCEDAYCEGCLPADADKEDDEGWTAVGHCDRFEELGQTHPNQAYFILCSLDCRKWKEEHPKIYLTDETPESPHFPYEGLGFGSKNALLATSDTKCEIPARDLSKRFDPEVEF